MFHVVLILMGLGFSAAIVAALLAPLWVGPLLQLLVTAFCKKKIYLLIPSILGALLAIYSVLQLGKAVPLLYLAIYWCVYYLLLFAAYGIVRGIQSMFRKKRPEQSGAAEKKG